MTQASELGRVLIVGLGLIGGSLAKGLCRAKVCAEVAGYDVNAESIKTALDTGVITTAVYDLSKAVLSADIVVLAVPVLSMKRVFEQIAPYLSESTVVTDVGSVKAPVLEAAKQVFGYLPQCLVLGHPIAGSERSGVEAANADLFAKHRVILSPHSTTQPAALQDVSLLWQSVGAKTVNMSCEYHDSVLSKTSHLPHLLAFSLVGQLANDDESDDIFQYAAGGFRDFTRIASSDPKMWHDIFVSNQAAMLPALDQYIEQLHALREMISQENSSELLHFLGSAKQERDRFSQILVSRGLEDSVAKHK